MAADLEPQLRAIADRYTVSGELARGGMAAVYLARSMSFLPVCGTLLAPTKLWQFSCTGRGPGGLTYVNPADQPSPASSDLQAAGLGALRSLVHVVVR